VGTSVLRPIFTVRSPPRCISRYKVDLLMPSDRAASLGDIAIGSFIWEVYLSFFGLLTVNLVRHHSQGSYVLTIFSYDVCSFLRVSQDFFWRVLGHFRGKLRSVIDSYTGYLLCVLEILMASSKPKNGQSLADLFPELSKEWHPTKNGKLTPSDVTKGSAKKFWWLCKKDKSHVWLMPVSARTGQGQGCPYCSGKRVTDQNSFKAWCLKNGSRGKLLLSEFVSLKNGKTVRDFHSNSHVLVVWKCSRCSGKWTASPNRRISMNSGCPFCSGQRVSQLNNLKINFPRVASQWHPSKNGTLRPGDVLSKSNKRVWWQCKVSSDHVWQATVESKTNKGDKLGCPFCRGLKVAKSNCLSTTHPEIARQWHRTKNKNLKPSQVTKGSGKKVWWQCTKHNSHCYQMPVSARTGQGQGCPYCAGRRVHETNSLAKAAPKIAAQFHPTKNGKLSPRDLTAKSGQSVWWKCDKGPDHEWKTTVNSRTDSRRSDSCPFCPPKIHQLSVTNSLKTWCKKNGSFGSLVLTQWDTKKNRKIRPNEVIYMAQRLDIHWQCSVAPDHHWVASPYRRTIDRQSCPFCSSRKSSSTNNLALKFPNLVKWIHPTKNPGLDPFKISPMDHSLIWWKCPEGPDHVFKTSPNAMKGNNRCGFCDGKRVSVTNSLQSRYPEVAKEFDKVRNKPLTPKSITYATGKKVWWKCSINSKHQWRAVVSNRTIGNQNCPYCVMAPRSRREIYLATELAHLFGGELGDHKIVLNKIVRDADIVIRRSRLVIEYDGSYWHRDSYKKDKAKIEQLRAAGWKIIRVREAPLRQIQPHDVLTTDREPLQDVVTKIIDAAGRLGVKSRLSSTKYRKKTSLITHAKAEQRIAEILKNPQSYAAMSERATWQAHFDKMAEFAKRYGHCEPQATTKKSDLKMTKWVKHQRRQYREQQLASDCVIALEGLKGWSWETYNPRWEQKFSALKVQTEKTKTVKIQPKNAQLKGLNSWVIHQRVLKHRNQLTSDQVTRLEALPGWTWDPIDEQWQDAFSALVRYVKRNNTSAVPQDHIENSFKLGIWVNKQRSRYRRGTLEAVRIAQLESLKGWTWVPSEDRSSRNITALKKFTKRTGHSKVPAKHIESGVELYSFVYNARRRYWQGNLSPSLKSQLVAVPHWRWK